MIIKLNGATTLNKLPQIVKEVVSDIQIRTGLDTVKFKVRDIQLGVVFNINGEEQFVTVKHDDIPEIFQVNVLLDEKGNVKRAVDNEAESFLDDYSRAVAKGVSNAGYEEVETEFCESELSLIEEINGGDIIQRNYRHKMTNELIMRFYRILDGKEILVEECGFKTK